MLIRSQDKTMITDVTANSIIIDTQNNILAYRNGVERFPDELGEYSSLEKAIKVLDMIQQEYEKHYFSQGGQHATVGTYVQAFGFVPPKVFQMPQDSEVEV